MQADSCDAPAAPGAFLVGPLPYPGDWVIRILGEELPEGVVLGEPSMVTITATESD